MIMKRLLTSAVLVLCTVLASFAQASMSGSGTESDPYKIYYPDQLNQVRNYLNQSGVVFKLMYDIDITDWNQANNPGQGWEPIGVESAPFKGVFDGNGKTISGFSITRSSTDYVGFFGYISGATVKNLTIEGPVTGHQYVGAFVGFGSGNNTLTGLTHNGTITAYGTAGHIVGQYSGTMNNVTATGHVTSTNGYAGGIIGYHSTTGKIISNVQMTGNVTSNGESVGGITGFSKATINNVTFSGEVYGSQYVGGIAGKTEASITEATVSGSVRNSADYVGGICGFSMGNGAMTHCYSYCDVIGTGDYVGGIIGKKSSKNNISYCASYGEVSGSNYVGGITGAIIGFGEQYPTLYSYTQYAATAGEARVLSDKVESVSSTTSFSVSNCLFSGRLHATGNYIGGISGCLDGGLSWTSAQTNTYINSSHYYITGVTGDSYYYGKRNEETGESEPITTSSVVKIYGKVWTPKLYYCNIKDCYCNGSIAGNQYTGGIVGLMKGGNLINNYSNAIIEGNTNVGGIAGKVQRFEDHTTTYDITVKSNMAINKKVSASANIGRIYGAAGENDVIVGANGDASEDNRALYDTQVVLSGVTQEIQDNEQNGVNNGDAYFKLQANYVAHGWDFNNNWTNLETETYPYKPWQAAPPTITSSLVSGSTSMSGNSTDGGTVYVTVGNNAETSVACSGTSWTLSGLPALQSGENVSLYTKVSGKENSYRTMTTVDFPGSGTEADPWLIYTADDLQGVYKAGYYKQMDDINLSTWITANSSTKGWIPVGYGGTDPIVYDGGNHKITGLWTNTTENYTGLFSSFSKGTIRNLTVEATSRKVKGGNYTGIVIGRIDGGTIMNVTAKGNVSAQDYVGGIAGYTTGTTLKQLSYTGQLTATGYVGGITSYTKSTTVTDCEAEDISINASASSYVGGLVAYPYSTNISNCNVSGSVSLTGTHSGAVVGGLVARSANSITECSTNITINSASPSGKTGGLVAYCNPATIKRCTSTGTVTSTGSNSYTGGLVAMASSGSSIEDCYSTADVSGTKWTAALVAYNYGNVNRCYASGNVASVYYGAGLVGENDGSRATTTNCVALGSKVEVSDQTGWGIRVVG